MLFFFLCCYLLLLGDDKGGVALTAVLTAVLVHRHEGVAVGVCAFAPETSHVAVVVNLVVVEDRKLDVFVLVGDSFGLGVDFFLSLLASTTIIINNKKLKLYIIFLCVLCFLFYSRRRTR